VNAGELLLPCKAVTSGVLGMAGDQMKNEQSRAVPNLNTRELWRLESTIDGLVENQLRCWVLSKIEGGCLGVHYSRLYWGMCAGRSW